MMQVKPMLQELRTQFKQVQVLREKVESRLQPQLNRASGELKKMLKQLGADVDQTHSLAEIVAQVRERNPSISKLMLNLDAATYDTRKQLSWNAHMLSAFAYNKAEQAYTQDLKPRLDNYRSRAESRIRNLVQRAGHLGRHSDQAVQETDSQASS